MAPLLRRSWARRGHRPQLFQEGQHRKKVSVAAAFWISPHRHRLGLFYQTLENSYFNNVRIVPFLEDLLLRLPGKIILVWDGGPMHKGDPIRDFLRQHPNRIKLKRLPPYAPMLNPVEPLWQWLKWCRLNNFPAREVHELNRKMPEDTSDLERKINPPTVIHSTQKVGRNDLCPCGSGKKFKKCCSDLRHFPLP